MNTRTPYDKFVQRAVHEAEKRLCIPPGWWGTWRDVYGPNGARVRYSGGGAWTVSQDGKRVSQHDSRANAIRAARRLGDHKDLT